VTAGRGGYDSLAPAPDEETNVNEDADAKRGDLGRSNDEPALNDRNSETVRGEEILARDSDEETAAVAYGKTGGTTDATEEGGDGSDL
jgi:hypothetical protein